MINQMAHPKHASYSVHIKEENEKYFSFPSDKVFCFITT